MPDFGKVSGLAGGPRNQMMKGGGGHVASQFCAGRRGLSRVQPLGVAPLPVSEERFQGSV